MGAGAGRRHNVWQVYGHLRGKVDCWILQVQAAAGPAIRVLHSPCSLRERIQALLLSTKLPVLSFSLHCHLSGALFIAWSLRLVLPYNPPSSEFLSGWLSFGKFGNSTVTMRGEFHVTPLLARGEPCQLCFSEGLAWGSQQTDTGISLGSLTSTGPHRPLQASTGPQDPWENGNSKWTSWKMLKNIEKQHFKFSQIKYFVWQQF